MIHKVGYDPRHLSFTCRIPVTFRTNTSLTQKQVLLILCWNTQTRETRCTCIITQICMEQLNDRNCIFVLQLTTLLSWDVSRVGQSVQWLATGRTTGRWGSIPGRDKGFFLQPLCPDRLSGPFCTMDTRDPLPGAKTRSGRDADH
jgi:hypothetical protein